MKRSTLILLGVFFILIILAYFLLPREGERMTSYSSAGFSVSLDSAAVAKLEISRPEKAVTIENLGGTWMITSPIRTPADPTAIRQVLSGMMKLKVGSLVSSNPEKQNVYQVDSTGTRLSFVDRSGKSLSLILGKTGPSYSEIYIRKPESQDVYLAEGLDGWMVNKELKEWRNRSILTVESSLIQQIVYSAGKKQFTLRRDSSNWWIDGSPMGEIVMKPVLNALSNLRADDFIDSAVSPAMSPLVVQVLAGEDHTFRFFPLTPDSSRYIVTSSTSPQAYTVSKWTVSQIRTPIEMRLR